MGLGRTQRLPANTHGRERCRLGPASFAASEARVWWRIPLLSRWRISADGSIRGLTFELRGRRRQDARPGPVKMYSVPPARAWWPAVGAPLERGVRPQRAALHIRNCCRACRLATAWCCEECLPIESHSAQRRPGSRRSVRP